MSSDAPPPDSPDEYPLSPEVLEENVEELEHARKLLAQRAAELDQPHDDPHDSRFSLAWVFVLVTGAALLLAWGRQMRPENFAAVCGVAVLVALALISALRIRWVVIHVAWWLLLAIYLLASALAVVRRDG